MFAQVLDMQSRNVICVLVVKMIVHLWEDIYEEWAIMTFRPWIE